MGLETSLCPLFGVNVFNDGRKEPIYCAFRFLLFSVAAG